jgi:hypothetical protein
MHIPRVGQNHIPIWYLWQGNHQIYGHIRCIYTRLWPTLHIPEAQQAEGAHVWCQRLSGVQAGAGNASTHIPYEVQQPGGAHVWCQRLNGVQAGAGNASTHIPYEVQQPGGAHVWCQRLSGAQAGAGGERKGGAKRSCKVWL